VEVVSAVVVTVDVVVVVVVAVAVVVVEVVVVIVVFEQITPAAREVLQFESVTFWHWVSEVSLPMHLTRLKTKGIVTAPKNDPTV
jgi:hypothetical protein